MVKKCENLQQTFQYHSRIVKLNVSNSNGFMLDFESIEISKNAKLEYLRTIIPVCNFNMSHESKGGILYV
jgi:hypothetical protein